MNVDLIEIDSRVFGRNVLSIHEFDPTRDFPEFERRYVDEYRPAYVSCKIPLERVSDTHVLERNGFNLIECQIRASFKLRKPFDVSAFPQYSFEPVTEDSGLDDVLDIAATTFEHDRFTIDFKLPPELSGKRYREYVMKSFRAPNEAVYRLVDRNTGRTVAFKTHMYCGSDEVLLLLGGVHPDYKSLGLGPLNGYFEFNEFIKKGIKRGITHISAANYPIFNLEISKLGYRVLTTFAILRKLYG